MIMPIIPDVSHESEAGLLVLEVELDIFQAAIGGANKPVLFHQHAGFPKQHRYIFRNGPYFLMYRQRESLDLSSQATIIPVKNFFTNLASVL